MEDNKELQEQMEQQGTGAEQENGSAENQQPEVTVESLLSELANVKAENAKNKAALDKALKNNGDLTKQLRARMTAQEQEDEAKREQQEQHEKYVKGIETELATIKATKRYMGIGMPEDLAAETAAAEIKGDNEAVTANMKKFMDSTIKAKEADWIKNRPPVNVGNGEDGDDKKDPFLAGFNS